ncbi:MAG: phosphatidate cytidylyltransferase [Deltaproteobacteria bacterium]|nr:phosphatidate cytidylyltransferase [Deltaproteobacteria bacterium]
MSETQPLRSEGEGPAAEPIHPQPPTPVSEEPSRRLSNTAVRAMTAAVLIPFVLWTIAQGGYLYLAVITGIILLGLREFYQMIEAKGADPLEGYGLLAGASLPVVAWFGSEYHATVLMTAVLLGVMVAQLRKAEISEAMASISGTFFGVFYVGWLLSHAIVLRNFHAMVESRWGFAAAASVDLEAGAYLMVFCLTAVVGSDAGAYFAGRAYGRRKLAPNISPSKTVEGALGGVLFGAFCALVCKALFDFVWPELSALFGYAFGAALAVILAVVGIVGDLVESLLKRDAAQKDAGALLPGMGGVLDRIDSGLIAIPVMYYVMLAYTWLQVI